MAGELAAFWAAVSSAAESVLKRSPGDTAHAEVLGELVAEFEKVEGQLSQLERPATRVCNLLIELPPGRVWLANRLDEAARKLRAELATWREAEAKLEALLSLAGCVRELVLGGANGSSLLATSMSMVAELLEWWIDAAATNGVVGDPVLHWLPLYHIS
jgi:hypothetical protein